MENELANFTFYDLEMRELGYNLREMNDRQAQKSFSQYTELDDRSFLLNFTL